jgi:hypothetical protein
MPIFTGGARAPPFREPRSLISSDPAHGARAPTSLGDDRINCPEFSGWRRFADRRRHPQMLTLATQLSRKWAFPGQISSAGELGMALAQPRVGSSAVTSRLRSVFQSPA